MTTPENHSPHGAGQHSGQDAAQRAQYPSALEDNAVNRKADAKTPTPRRWSPPMNPSWALR